MGTITTHRLDLFVRPDSKATDSGVRDFAYKWANDRTNSDKNKDEDGNLINAYYVDVTDSRTSNKFMVFGDKAQEILGLSKNLEILDKSKIATKEDISAVDKKVEEKTASSDKQNTEAVENLQSSIKDAVKLISDNKESVDGLGKDLESVSDAVEKNSQGLIDVNKRVDNLNNNSSNDNTTTNDSDSSDNEVEVVVV